MSTHLVGVRGQFIHQTLPYVFHRDIGGILGMAPLIINPIYTLYTRYLLGISPFKGLLGGLNSWGTT